MRISANKQIGSAIITALTLMIIVASIAYLMLARQSIVTQQTILNNNADKAYYYHNIAVTKAQVFLKDALSDPLFIFNAGDDTRVIDFPIPPPETNSEISATLYDLQGRFNLAEFNSLDIGDPEKVAIFNQKFITLLEGAGVDPSDGQDVFEAILAHITTPPGFSFTNPSQLRPFFGDAVALYQNSIAQMSVLDKVAPININTATIPVLMTLGDPNAPEGLVSFDTAKTIVDDRIATPITEESLADDYLLRMADNEVGSEDLGFISDYFLLETRVILNKNKQTQQTFEYYTLFQTDSSTDPVQVRIAKESIGTPL